VHRRLKPILERVKTMPSLPRQVLGVLLMLGGLFWFLPVLGLWMIPLGLLILSVDFRWARRGYLSVISWLRKWRDHNRRKRNNLQ
jgi:hypothetical protein